MHQSDHSMMRRALVGARRWAGRCWPNPTVGACLAGDDGWLCEGVHRGAGSPHAETEVIAQARSQGLDLRRSTLHVSLEPCNHHGRTGPCSEAILEAGIPRVVYACTDPNPGVAGGGAERLAEAGVDVRQAPENWRRLAAELNHPFFEAGFGARPHVTLKLAMDADGRIARQPGRVADPALRAVTGERVQRRVHSMRDASSCVLVGRGTVFADQPRLDVRRVTAHHRPRPVVLDTHLSSQAEALPEGSLLLHGAAEGVRIEALLRAGHECLLLDGGPRSWPAVFSALRGRGLGIVLVEGGAAVADSLLAAGLADRLHLFLAPQRLGGDGPRVEALGELGLQPEALQEAGSLHLAGADWTVLRCRRVGADWEWVLRR